MKFSIATRSCALGMLLLSALSGRAESHTVSTDFGNYDNPWMSVNDLRAYNIEDYKVVDPDNPQPGVYPYDDQGIKVMSFNNDSYMLRTRRPLSHGLSKLSFKYCLGGYHSNPASLVVTVKQGEDATESQTQVFTIDIDEGSLYFDPSGRTNNKDDYYCMPHVWEMDFDIPTDAVVIVQGREGYYNGYEIIVWDVEWTDGAGVSSPVKPDNGGSWHSGYSNILDLDNPAGAFDGFEFTDIAAGELLQLDNATYRYPVLDPNVGPIVINIASATLSALQDGTYALDFEAGAQLEIEAEIRHGVQYSRLQHIIVRHDIADEAAFDDGHIYDELNSLTHWPQPQDPQQLGAMAATDGDRIVCLTATRAVRVYGVAVAQPLVVTTLPAVTSDGADGPERLYDLRGIGLIRPVAGQLYICVDADGRATLRRAP